MRVEAWRVKAKVENVLVGFKNLLRRYSNTRFLLWQIKKFDILQSNGHKRFIWEKILNICTFFIITVFLLSGNVIKEFHYTYYQNNDICKNIFLVQFLIRTNWNRDAIFTLTCNIVDPRCGYIKWIQPILFHGHT